MKLLLALSVLALTACGASTVTTVTVAQQAPRGAASENAPGKCGKERWSVKTMTDDAANQVDLKPKRSHVYTLDRLVAPVKPTIRQSSEKQVYVVKASVIAFKQEADSDIHLALVDPVHQDATMIAEFPASSCDVGSSVKPQIDTAREAFVTAYGQPTDRYQRITGTISITGVLFFDRIHGQLGVAPNGVELHPVIGFRRLP